MIFGFFRKRRFTAPRHRSHRPWSHFFAGSRRASGPPTMTAPRRSSTPRVRAFRRRRRDGVLLLGDGVEVPRLHDLADKLVEAHLGSHAPPVARGEVDLITN